MAFYVTNDTSESLSVFEIHVNADILFRYQSKTRNYCIALSVFQPTLISSIMSIECPCILEVRDMTFNFLLSIIVRYFSSLILFLKSLYVSALRVDGYLLLPQSVEHIIHRLLQLKLPTSHNMFIFFKILLESIFLIL